MLKHKLFFSIFIFSTTMHADLCPELKSDVSVALGQISAPGIQLFAALPDGKICSIGVGQFAIGKPQAMTVENPMKIWSISKTFTHVAVLQLIESGYLYLDQKLRYLEMVYPDLYQGQLKHYPNSENITLRHLLSHTSGIIDYMTLPEYLNNWKRPVTIGNIVLSAAKAQDKIEPGTLNRYSNTTMMILARIVEKVTAVSIENYIYWRFILPLGLNSTYLATDATGWGPIYGYVHNDPVSKSFSDATNNVSPSMVWGTGAVVSTANDIGKWFHAVLTGKILKPETTAMIFKPTLLKNGDNAEYGLGFHIQHFSNGFVLIGHGGGPLEGNSATMLYSPQLNTIIVSLANGSTEHSNTVLGALGWKRVADYLQEKPIPKIND